jgi:heme/copper-type cytochrome/quinol oxidase subunit 3
MPAVIDIVCYYYLCYDTFCYIPVEREGTIIGSKEPFCFGSSLKGAIFLYNTSLALLASCLACGWARYQIYTKTPNTIMSTHCCTVALPILLKLVSHGMAWHYFGLLSAYFTLFFFFASLAGLNVRLTDPSLS